MNTCIYTRTIHLNKVQTNWFKILLVKIQCMIFYYNTDTFAWEKYVHRLIIPLTYMICDILFSWTVGFIGENANKRQWFSIFKMILSVAELFWDRVYRIYIYCNQWMVVINLHVQIFQLYEMFNIVIKQAPESHGEWLGLVRPTFHRV